MLPNPDLVIQLRMRGSTMIKALENSVSMVPSFAGRFAQFSGLNFKYDSSKEAGSRVVSTECWKTGKPIDPEEFYICVLFPFVAKGKDGYTMFIEDPDV